MVWRIPRNGVRRTVATVESEATGTQHQEIGSADDGTLPPDNDYIENRIRTVALGRSNWLFAGSLRAGQRAAAIMSLIQSARMNGVDPYAYLNDVFTRLPTVPANRIEEPLPHRWAADAAR